MKITDAYGKFQVTSPVTTGAKGPGGAAPVGKSAGHGHVQSKDSGRVHVSDEAKALEAKSAGDSAKIERLKASIADGSFKVDAKQIASKIAGDDEEPEE